RMFGDTPSRPLPPDSPRNWRQSVSTQWVAPSSIVVPKREMYLFRILVIHVWSGNHRWVYWSNIMTSRRYSLASPVTLDLSPAYLQIAVPLIRNLKSPTDRSYAIDLLARNYPVGERETMRRLIEKYTEDYAPSSRPARQRKPALGTKVSRDNSGKSSSERNKT